MWGERLARIDSMCQQAVAKGDIPGIVALVARNGKIVYDLNGISRPEWTKLPSDYKMVGDPRWDGLNPARRAQ